MQYLFEDFLLDIERHELRKGEAVLPVEPQVFDLLAFLIRHRERVVSRDELLASIWEGRNVSDSTFTSRINAARGALGDSGEDQRLIRTVPRRGYRFVGVVREEPGVAAVPTVAIRPVSTATEARHSDDLSPVKNLPAALTRVSGGRFRLVSLRTIVMLSAAAVIGAIAATLLSFAWVGAFAPASRTGGAQRFDASVVPLVTDEVRRTLIGYAQRPDAKALAIASEGWSVVDGASSPENAEKEALRQCAARAKGLCRIYASGMEVAWSKDTLPLPAATDLRSEPLETQLVADEIPTLNSTTRRAIADGYMKRPNHKALALTTRGYFWVNNMPTRGEPARLAVERCAELTQRPCLLLAIDGFLTIRIPKSRQVERIFLPSTESEISTADRERIARIYQGDEWRALARGKKGSWHPVAAAPSEAAAIDGALKSCSQVDEECRLYAIGNFRVAEE